MDLRDALTILQRGVLLISVSGSSMLSQKGSGAWRFHPTSAVPISSRDEHSELRSRHYRMALSALPVPPDYLEDQIKSSKSHIKCHALQKFTVVNHQNKVLSKE